MSASTEYIPTSLLPGTGTHADFGENLEEEQPDHDASLSSRLDTVESTSHPDALALMLEPPLLDDLPIPTFRHRSWHDRRVRVANALTTASVSNHRYRSFISCGCQAWVLRSVENPHDFKVVPDFCHDRWCVPCANGRASRISANLLEHLQDRQTRFITLTLAASDAPLRPRLDRLLASFSKLRRRRFWTDRVVGGAGFLEVTRGKSGHHWHPHLHVVVEGQYIAKEQLVQTWLEITGDSYVVDIKLVRDPGIVGRYITKYASKPLDSKLLRDPPALVEAIQALRGRKLLYAFGTWARWKLLAIPTNEAWTLFGHINELIYREASGDELAHLVLLLLQHSPDVFDGHVFQLDLQPEPPPCPTETTTPTDHQSQLFSPSHPSSSS